MSMLRIGRRVAVPQLVAAAILLALAGLAAPAAMAAEGERVLDPRLSLIGGCLEAGVREELDPVEDPGCPETPPPGDHPPATFAWPNAVKTDFHGDIYVASRGKNEQGTEARIDIFSPEGKYISEIPQGVVKDLLSIAIDSQGTLYVYSRDANETEESADLLRFEPCAPYNPTAGQISYCESPTVVPLAGPECSFACHRNYPSLLGLAINRANDHLFAKVSEQVIEFNSAAEGNEELRTTHVPGNLGNGSSAGVAVDSARHRLYAQEVRGEGGKLIGEIGIYELVEGLPRQAEYTRIGSIEESAVPEGHFGSSLALAADEGTGNLYVYDTENTHLWELDEDGNYLATVEFPFRAAGGMEISVDNGLNSPNGKLSEEEERGRYLYVPSHPKTTPGHVFAFFEATVSAPAVESPAAVDISEDEAELQARINPGNLETTYTFQLKVDGAAGWTTVGEGVLPAGNLDVTASAAARGLAPATHYLFRVLAANEAGSGEGEASFATYPNLPAEPIACGNALLRTGPSALLPDCRAYELVTPADTNARAPIGAEGLGGGFTTRQVSPAGDKVPFLVKDGSLPDLGGTGSLAGDPYLATRTPAGWSTAYTGPSAAEVTGAEPGTTTDDQGFSFWLAGTAAAPNTGYVRYPDGHVELVGQGSLGIDPETRGQFISEGGGHIVFTTGTLASPAVQLEPAAAPDGTRAVYDRTGGTTHVVSLKPGNLPFAAGENAGYDGASPDGAGIAFEANGTLYLRYHDTETFEIGEGADFAGFAEGGGRIFYLQGGDLKAFDAEAESVTVFADTPAPVAPVTVSTDGSTAYFISESAVAGAGPNPQGAEPAAGGDNLYRSKEGHVAFVGTVTERDAVGAGGTSDGLDLWIGALTGTSGSTPFLGALGLVPARSTPDGGVFVFKSRARLTGYDNPEERAEIYRYESAGNRLQCLSCNPTGARAESDATLQSENREGSQLYSALAWPENLRADGRRVFFESSEPLVARDTDGLQDVYEWEEQGVGSCTQAGGCVYLISSPASRRNEFLWAVSRSGDDVFFLSSDLLLNGDADETPSIYDARVGGGFPEPAPSECQGEGCRPQLTPPPPLPSGETPVRGAGDQVKRRACGRGKHRVKRRGKVRCVRKKHHRRHGRHGRRRAGAGRKGGPR